MNIWWIIVRICREYFKNYVKHPFKIKGYILLNFVIPWKNPGESTDAVWLSQQVTTCSTQHGIDILKIEIKAKHEILSKAIESDTGR